MQWWGKVERTFPIKMKLIANIDLLSRGKLLCVLHKILIPMFTWDCESEGGGKNNKFHFAHSRAGLNETI